MTFRIGDRVKVIEQDIIGTVVAYDCGNKVVIDDDDLEDNLVFNTSDLELLPDVQVNSIVCVGCGKLFAEESNAETPFVCEECAEFKPDRKVE